MASLEPAVLAVALAFKLGIDVNVLYEQIRMVAWRNEKFRDS